MARQPTPNVFDDLFRNPAVGAPVQVDLELVDDNPFQPRQTYDPATLRELANSIERNGLQQPPAGRWAGGRMQLVFGHRRKRAYDLLRAKDPVRWAAMPVFAVQVTDEDMAARAWTENVERDNLTAIEQAQSIHTMIERFGWTQAQVAERLGLSASAVSNKLRLLRAPQEVQQAVATGEISERQAAAMMPVFDLPKGGLRKDLSGYTVEHLISQAKSGQSSDNLRERASMVVKAATQSLAVVPWTTTDLRRLDVRHFICSSCPMKIIATGGEERCADQACFDIKQQAWADYEMAALVEATGVPSMPLKVRYDEYQSFWGEDRRIAEEHGLNKAPLCERLRVARGGDGLKIEGVDGGTLVCYHQGKRCECLAKLKSSLSKDGKARWKRVREQTKEALTAALSAPTPDTLRLVAGFFAAYDKRSQVAGWTMDDVVGTIVKALIEQVQPYSAETRVDEAESEMANLLARAFITPPWSLAAQFVPVDPLAQMKGKLHLILSWIASLTRINPFQTELNTFTNDLNAMLMALTELPESIERALLADRADKAQRSLVEMGALVADGYTVSDCVSWIVNTPISDINAKMAVEKATREDLLWANAICRIMPAKATTMDAIRRALKRIGDPVPAVSESTTAVYVEKVNEKLDKRRNAPNGYIEPTVDREAPDYIDAKLQRIVGWIDDYQDPGDGLPTPESVAGNFANLEKLLEVIAGQQSEADQLKLKLLYDEVYNRLAALSDRVTQSYAQEANHA